MTTEPRREVARELQAIAEELESLEFLRGQPGGFPPEEILERLLWLRREGRAGRSHTLSGFLGPETVVWVYSNGQRLIRRYGGVDLSKV